MVDVTLLQSASYIAAALGVVLAALNYVVTSRREEKRSKQNNETRQAQIFMDIFQRMMDAHFIESEKVIWGTKNSNYDDYENAFKNTEFYNAFFLIGYWLEGIGVLVKEKLVDVRLPVLLYSGIIVGFWGMFGPYILVDREKYGFPRRFVEAEYLYNRVVEYAAQHPELKIRVSS